MQNPPMDSSKTEIAATAARLVVEEGLEYGPAKRRAVKLLGLNARAALPDNAEVEDAVREAVNDTLKAIAASLLMEQVLAPRFNFTPKDHGPVEGFDYGEGGYKPGETNVGVNEATGPLCAPNIWRTSFSNWQVCQPMGKVMADAGVKAE